MSIKVQSPTEQVELLRRAVAALNNKGTLSQGLTNSLVKKLDTAQRALNEGRSKVAYTAIVSFRSEVQSLIADEVLIPEQTWPLLSAAELLLQSLRTGGFSSELAGNTGKPR